MSESDAADLIREFLWIILLTGGPAIATTACAGTIVAVLQALTQIQEATLTVVAKLIALAGVIVLAGSLSWQHFEGFARAMFQRAAIGMSG